MNFNEKVDNQFSRFILKTPNYPTNLVHLYADYVELVALFSNDNFVTSSDIQDRLIDEGVENIEEDLGSTSEIGSTKSEQMDSIETRIRNIFLLIEERSTLYKDHYPFIYSKEKLKLKEQLDYKNELYLMLLTASNLKLFNKVQSELTSEFEVISFYVLKNYLPEKAIVKQFGKQSDYDGNAKTKIKELAKDLQLEIDEYEINQISERNIQERGLDIIGWIPFDDECPNMLVILAQCACGKKWHGKHHDTTRFENYYNFYKSKPQHALFIPYSLINYSVNKFYQSDEVENNRMVFERKRLIEYFKEEDVFNNLDSKKLIEKCIDYQEDIV